MSMNVKKLIRLKFIKVLEKICKKIILDWDRATLFRYCETSLTAIYLASRAVSAQISYYFICYHEFIHVLITERKLFLQK